MHALIAFGGPRRSECAKMLEETDADLAQWQSSGFVNHRFPVRARGSAQRTK